MNEPSKKVVITKSASDIPCDEVLSDEKHILLVTVDRENQDVYLKFSSRLALYDFARSLLHEAVFGEGTKKEFYPLVVEGNAQVVEGVRLANGSSRIFLDCEEGVELTRKE